MRRTEASVAAEEAADIIAESPVPLLPTVADEAAHLVQPGRVPGLGDELGARQRRVRLDIPQHRRIRHQLARFIARQDGREIETEPVHVHLLDPIAEAVHDHPADDRMVGVERVSRAAVVGIARAVLLEDVVGACCPAREN